MIGRKKKIRELIENLYFLRRHMAFASVHSMKMPRITPAQWGALIFIEHSGKSTVKDVAKGLNITSSATTQLIDGLVSSGYVTRKEDARDRRKALLILSQKSRSHIAKMKEHILNGFLKTFEVLNDQEFSQYLALNKKLARVFPRKN